MLKICLILNKKTFRRNFTKIRSQKEEIIVTHRGSQIFTIVPKKVELKKRWESLFGTLPPEAVNDDDISRE